MAYINIRRELISMSDELQKKIFSENLNRLLQGREKTQSEVAKEIDVSPQTFNTWTQGIAIPRMGKIQRLADYFHIEKSALLDKASQEQTYYTNPETAKVAQEIFDNSDLRILFDAAKDSSPEQLKLAAEMLRQFKKTSGEDND
nr:MAG TPA: Repressor protein CI [Caudoviricetes sp.]